MKKITPLLSLLILTFPLFTNAAGAFNLIVCDGPDCDFGSLLTLFKNGIKALVEIATIITVIALIVMGIRLLTSGGKPGELIETKKRAIGIVKGYVVILAAWLIVYTILNTLVYDKFNIVRPQ